MEIERRFWNEQQKKLQDALQRGGTGAVDLFLSQHAMVHSARMSEARLWSFEDEVLQDMDENVMRGMHGEHSIAWILLHMARCEDVTMNLLVAGRSQVLTDEDWCRHLHIRVRHTGNAMDEPTIAHLSATIDLEALRAYRVAVGRRTREIVRALKPASFKQKIDPARVQRIWDEGAVLDEACDIVDYWSKRTIAGLLLMPPTRHNFIHLNEVVRLKKHIQTQEERVSTGVVAAL